MMRILGVERRKVPGLEIRLIGDVENVHSLLIQSRSPGALFSGEEDVFVLLGDHLGFESS